MNYDSKVGYTGLRWLVASWLLSSKDRDELAYITPGIPVWNSHSTWHPWALRWKQDFPPWELVGKVHVGPRAILPMSVALAMAPTAEVTG